MKRAAAATLALACVGSAVALSPITAGSAAAGDVQLFQVPSPSALGLRGMWFKAPTPPTCVTTRCMSGTWASATRGPGVKYVSTGQHLRTSAQATQTVNRLASEFCSSQTTSARSYVVAGVAYRATVGWLPGSTRPGCWQLIARYQNRIVSASYTPLGGAVTVPAPSPNLPARLRGYAMPSGGLIPLSAPLAPAGPNVKNVVYFGNPTNKVASLADYTITGTGTSADGTPFVDTVVLFAANINSASGQWESSPNTPVLDLKDSNLGGPTGPPPTEPRDLTWINPAVTKLHAKGIKVLLGILPNHDGTGWSCPGMSTAAQLSLANQIAAATKKYKFDGISIDDEYSECPKGNDGPGGSAAVNIGIVKKLRANPAYQGKLITKSVLWDTFEFPPATTPPASNSIAPYIDQAWTEIYPSDYGDLQPYQEAGLANSQLGLSSSPTSDPAQVAQAVVQNKLGFMMVWASDGNFSNSARAAIYTQVVQGEFGSTDAKVTYTGS